MSTFSVIAVIDGDTFDVSPNWQWKGQSGNRVRPTFLNAPELNEPGGQAAKQQLERLILNKTVEIGNAYRIDRGRLVCDVFYNGRSLASYFQYSPNRY